MSSLVFSSALTFCLSPLFSPTLLRTCLLRSSFSEWQSFCILFVFSVVLCDAGFVLVDSHCGLCMCVLCFFDCFVLVAVAQKEETAFALVVLVWPIDSQHLIATLVLARCCDSLHPF